MNDHSQPSTGAPSPASLSFADFQQLIEKMYGQKDRTRGVEGTFMWFMEEVGELSTALREGRKDELEGEFADVVAWLTTMANVAGIDLTKAIHKKYGTGCPGCQKLLCICPPEEKP